MKVLISALVLLVAAAGSAEAQQLKLQMANGRVTLDAMNVPVRQILSEWARIGGTKIVGGEKVVGAPLTLKLVDMPERQALDIILRNVAGFMAAPRLASAAAGASTYDRILIMATSSAVASSAARPGVQPAPSVNGNQRRLPQRPPNVPPSFGDEAPADDQAPVDDQADTGAQPPPVFTFPAAPNGNAAPGAANPPVFVPMPNNQIGSQAPGTVTAPVITLQPGANGPTIYNFVPQDQQAPPQPGAFGVVGGAARPGMIQQPAPAPGQPVQPAPTTRPPGGV